MFSLRPSLNRLLSTVLLAILLPGLLLLALPAGALAQAGSGAPPEPPTRPNPTAFEGLGLTRPYYDPEVLRTYFDYAYIIEDELEGFLPEALLPVKMDPGESKRQGCGGDNGSSSRDPSGIGTGGWYPLELPYEPSADPDVSYDVWTGAFARVDNSGRLHAIYARQVDADISELPDGAGYRVQPLADTCYTMYQDGSWTTPENLTEVSGLWDSDPVATFVDSADCFHVIYTKYSWGRDPTEPAGTWTAYYHQNENLYYRYRDAEGNWSAETRISSYTGNWSMLGAEFQEYNHRLYGSWVAIRNDETAPVSSYRASVGFVEGAKSSWSGPQILSQWDYTDEAGQSEPVMYPSLSVSEVGGEVTVVYSTTTTAAALEDYTSEILGAVRSVAGTWSGPDSVLSGAANERWMPITVMYKQDEMLARVLVLSGQFLNDAAHPVRESLCIMDHDSEGWNPPLDVAGAESGESAFPLAIRADALGYFRFFNSVVTYQWDPVGLNWEPAGARMNYREETPGGFSDFAEVRPYEAGTFSAEAGLVVDYEGNPRMVFGTFRMDGGGVESDFNLYYSADTGSGLSEPERIRNDTDRTIFDLTLTGYPSGDILASWFEKRWAGGEPTVGAMYSRLYKNGTWRPMVEVSEIPGDTNLVRSEEVSWPDYCTTGTYGVGEQQVVFETARYRPATADFVEFRKYFVETVNAQWKTPELISSLEVGGRYPEMSLDFNRRIFVLYASDDPTTTKEVLYGTMQRLPTPPATTYYFAEGTTRDGFEEWICIQNANDTAVTVDITYMLGTGENLEQNLTVEAHSRATVDVNSYVGEGQDVSTKVESDRLIVAERPMYFDYYGWPGGHDSTGATAPSRKWYFAEGTTRGGFSEYLTVQNPSDTDAAVDVTYILDDGLTMEETLDVPARSRYTRSVNEAVGGERDVSMVLECEDTAIVAERPMYFDYQGSWPGGHDVMGSTGLANRWYFAEGTTRSGFDTYLCVQNPNEMATQVDFTYVLGDGSTQTDTRTVEATSRNTYKVNDIIGPDHDVSVVIDSECPILVERPMYFSYRDGVPGYSWTGGHVAMGTRSPRNAWYFAEGTTRSGFEEWISIENPGDIEANAMLSFMLEDGTVIEHAQSIPPHTRQTVEVPAVVGTERDVSVEIWSDRGIIAERPMYYNYHGNWPGGHDVVGL